MGRKHISKEPPTAPDVSKAIMPESDLNKSILPATGQQNRIPGKEPATRDSNQPSQNYQEIQLMGFNMPEQTSTYSSTRIQTDITNQQWIGPTTSNSHKTNSPQNPAIPRSQQAKLASAQTTQKSMPGNRNSDLQ